jgi:hypothetical protein
MPNNSRRVARGVYTSGMLAIHQFENSSRVVVLVCRLMKARVGGSSGRSLEQPFFAYI